MQREYVQGEVPGDVVSRAPAKRVLRVPPLRPVETAHVGEKYGRVDAERQAEMIRAAWKRAGHEVDAYVETFKSGGQTCWRVVLPGMVNGLPVAVIEGVR